MTLRLGFPRHARDRQGCKRVRTGLAKRQARRLIISRPRLIEFIRSDEQGWAPPQAS